MYNEKLEYNIIYNLLYFIYYLLYIIKPDPLNEVLTQWVLGHFWEF